jgi:cysteine-rich repeat protein
LSSNETCDDGNTMSGDGCSSDCQTVEPGWHCRVPGALCVPICGDGILKGGETCDDGNTLNGDGCSMYCLTEPGCSGVDGGIDSGCQQPYCGDGILSGAEECDRGALNSDTEYGGCTTRCFAGPFCGDGMVNGPEECDLGAQNGTAYGPGGCTLGCTKTHYCGDGFMDSNLGEECDLGDRNGLKLDRNGNPSDTLDALVYCMADCKISMDILH